MEALITTFEGNTCAEVWLVAVGYLFKRADPAYSLILGIRNPEDLTAADFKICQTVDCFFAEHDSQPISTVTGTIFPAGFYADGGVEAVFNEYPKAYEKVREGWGNYAYRMLRKSSAAKTGKKDGFMVPLETMVNKIKAQLKSTRFKAVYEQNLIEVDDLLELPIYDAALDATRTRQHPCLSHLSFKLMPKNRIMLTAFYRYHYYVEKALGNLLGLAQLLSFVAKETGLEPGPLVCHSSFAVLDVDRWTRAEVGALLEECQLIASADTSAVAV